MSPAAPDPVPAVFPPAARLLDTLKEGHPRLFATREEFERLQPRLASDKLLATWWNRLKGEADRVLGQAPVEYVVQDGGRLRAVGSRVVTRAYVLGFAWRMTGDRRYSDRLRREYEALAAFKDWNPSALLDLGEICHGVAVGYDWCHDAWSPAERAVVRAAMVEKGLRPGLPALTTPEAARTPAHLAGSTRAVGEGGLILGALAVADEAREVAAEVLAAGTSSFRTTLGAYAPDGGWLEGPAYWNYATIYAVACLAGMESALGTEFGLSGMPGFAATARFPIHLTGPRGRTFNFGDSRDGELHGPHLFWLARRFGIPEWAREQRVNSVAHPLDFLWYDEALASRPGTAEPLDRHFRGVEVVTLRSAWGEDPGATFRGRHGVFVGFKAGDNRAHHGHLDAGSFVLDAGGFRWALDRGPEAPAAPGYMDGGSKRWEYHLARAEGHNTIVLNPGPGPDQDPTAVTTITRFVSRTNEAFAVADLTPAYAANAKRVHRAVALRRNRTEVLVQDEVDSDKPVDLWWLLHTSAKIEVLGRNAVLSYGSNRLSATLIGGGPDAVFSVTEAEPFPSSPRPAAQNKSGLQRLTVQLKQVRDPRLAVLLTPEPPATAGGGAKGATDGVSTLVPIAEWK